MTDVKNFYERLKTDQNLVEEMVSLKEAVAKGDKKYLADETLVDKKIISIAKNYGFEFSEEELKSYAKEQLSKLSEEELLSVTGGVGGLVTAIVTGGLALCAYLLFPCGNAGNQPNEQTLQQNVQLAARAAVEGDRNAVPQKSAEELKKEADKFFDTLCSQERGKFEYFHKGFDYTLLCMKSADNPMYKFAEEHGLLDETGTYLCHVLADDIVEVTPFLDESGECVIPSEVFLNGRSYKVTKIMREALYGCKALKSVRVSEGVTSLVVGERAFRSARIAQFSFPSSLTELELGRAAFSYCEMLDKFIVPESVTELKLGEDVFACSAIYEFHIKPGLDKLEIPCGAFNQCSRLSVFTGPASLTELKVGDKAFASSGITRLDLPSDLEVLELCDDAFGGCRKLREFIVPESVIILTLDENVFAYSNVSLSAIFRGCKNLRVVHLKNKNLEWQVRAALEACGRSDVDVILTD